MSKILPTHKGLKRIKKYTLEEVFKWIEINPSQFYWENDGYIINTKRAKIFRKKGITCVNCGCAGSFFALETDKGGGVHLDLYGFINELEVLITIDHIIPKSKGGTNNMINFQTMCKICNENKADKSS